MAVLAAALAVLLSVPTLAQSDAGSDSNQYDARITATTGDVTVYPVDDPSQPAAGAQGTLLAEGDRVVVADGGSAELSLDGDSLIELASNSDFTLTSLSRAEAKLSLAFGSLIAKIQKLGEDDRLEVDTPAAVAAVRGTELGVDFSVGGDAHVGVFDEGRVEVSGSGGEELLTPDQETSVRRGGRPERAGPLRRFRARRELMRRSLRRLAFIHRSWRRIPAGRRRLMRREGLMRLRRAFRARPGARRGLRREAPRALRRTRGGRSDERKRGDRDDERERGDR